MTTILFAIQNLLWPPFTATTSGLYFGDLISFFVILGRFYCACIETAIRFGENFDIRIDVLISIFLPGATSQRFVYISGLLDLTTWKLCHVCYLPQ